MSSKKQRRRERRRKEQAERPGLSSATLFILVIGVALLGLVTGAVLLDLGAGPEAGQVWSPEHGHYH